MKKESNNSNELVILKSLLFMLVIIASISPPVYMMHIGQNPQIKIWDLIFIKPLDVNPLWNLTAFIPAGILLWILVQPFCIKKNSEYALHGALIGIMVGFDIFMISVMNKGIVAWNIFAQIVLGIFVGALVCLIRPIIWKNSDITDPFAAYYVTGLLLGLFLPYGIITTLVMSCVLVCFLVLKGKTDEYEKSSERV